MLSESETSSSPDSSNMHVEEDSSLRLPATGRFRMKKKLN
jgi:hypothetical protein